MAHFSVSKSVDKDGNAVYLYKKEANLTEAKHFGLAEEIDGTAPAVAERRLRTMFDSVKKTANADHWTCRAMKPEPVEIIDPVTILMAHERKAFENHLHRYVGKDKAQAWASLWLVEGAKAPSELPKGLCAELAAAFNAWFESTDDDNGLTDRPGLADEVDGLIDALLGKAPKVVTDKATAQAEKELKKPAKPSKKTKPYDPDTSSSDEAPIEEDEPIVGQKRDAPSNASLNAAMAATTVTQPSKAATKKPSGAVLTGNDETYPKKSATKPHPKPSFKGGGFKPKKK